MQLILKIESSPVPLNELPQARAWIAEHRQLTVGRASGDLLVPRDPGVSGQHFQITCDGQQCQLADLKSTNGTYLNDVRVRQARLRDGDRIRAGKTVFSVQITGAAAEPVEDTGPDLVRSSSLVAFPKDEPPPVPNEPLRIFNNTSYQYALLPGRVRFPGYSLTVVVKGTFKLNPGGTVLLADEQLPVTGDIPYDDAASELAAPRYESDIAYFKPKADLLLVGHCYTPGGEETSKCEAEFRVGSRTRRVAVFGQRYWQGFMGAKVSEPKKFTKMPLRYELAYGGDGYDRNPVGRGYVKIQSTEGNLKLPLPCIEDVRASHANASTNA